MLEEIDQSDSFLQSETLKTVSCLKVCIIVTIVIQGSLEKKSKTIGVKVEELKLSQPLCIASSKNFLAIIY